MLFVILYFLSIKVSGFVMSSVRRALRSQMFNKSFDNFVICWLGFYISF